MKFKESISRATLSGMIAIGSLVGNVRAEQPSIDSAERVCTVVDSPEKFSTLEMKARVLEGVDRLADERARTYWQRVLDCKLVASLLVE